MTAPGDISPLQLQEVNFGYEDKPIIQGFTAALAPGRLCALLGPNAAGKSTLMRLMLGQLSPWQGSVRLCGQEAGKLPAPRRAALVSYVPQRGGVSFAFTIEQVVAMGRFALPADPQAVAKALDQCDLLELGQRLYNTLSVGQQQRVLLARAIAQCQGAGRLMLLDEPGSAMDLWHVHQMMAVLAGLRDQGLAVLVVLHDLNLAARYADEVWLMDQGRLVAAGPWQEVLNLDLLEPIYRVKLRRWQPPEDGRPVFYVAP